MTSPEELNKIVKGCKSENRTFQRQLYQLYQKKMFGVCLRYVKDYTEAEDIAQDGFVKIFKNINKLKDIEALESWMRKIMINTAMERFRSQRNMFTVSNSHSEIEQENNEDVVSLLSAKELLKLIHNLPPAYRTVFSLYAIDGYKHKEIGKMLGISTGTSKSNLSRARTILQEKIKPLYSDNENKILKRC